MQQRHTNLSLSQTKQNSWNNVFIINNNHFKRCKIHTWNLTFPFQDIISLCCIFTPQRVLTKGLSFRSTMHNAAQRCITYQSGYLSTSSSPHPALTCPTILPGLRVWKPQGNEGMDCAMNGSRCVIFTFAGSSPPVFHYNNSPVGSDKADDVAIRHDNSPQPERSTLSCPLSFLMLGSREDNGRERKQLHVQSGKMFVWETFVKGLYEDRCLKDYIRILQHRLYFPIFFCQSD